jgi:hypothetical protein
MGQLRELIWNRLTGKHSAADVALEQTKAGYQSGIDTVAVLLGVEMLDAAFVGQVSEIRILDSKTHKSRWVKLNLK